MLTQEIIPFVQNNDHKKGYSQEAMWTKLQLTNFERSMRLNHRPKWYN